MRGLFVTGTDTEVGKTHVSVALLREMVRRGIRAVGMKPVASGASDTIEGLRNDDALGLHAAGFEPVPYERVNPYCFRPPIAPHLAAAAVDTRIELEPILAAAAALRQRADCLLVEGVGGWRVPLGAFGDVGALASALDLPVVLVVGLRLGCISHALLTAGAIRADGCHFAGWIGNAIDPHYEPLAGTLETLAERLGAGPLAVFPHSAGTTDSGTAAATAVQALLFSKS